MALIDCQCVKKNNTREALSLISLSDDEADRFRAENESTRRRASVEHFSFLGVGRTTLSDFIFHFSIDRQTKTMKRIKRESRRVSLLLQMLMPSFRFVSKRRSRFHSAHSNDERSSGSVSGSLTNFSRWPNSKRTKRTAIIT